VATPDDVPKVIREALRNMRCGRPRPSYIETPLDVQSGETDVAPLPPERYSRPAGDPASVDRAAEARESAKRPFIFAGGGVESAQASRSLARVAESLGAPVVTSVFGRGAISDRHPLAAGDARGGRRSRRATAGAATTCTTS